MAVIIDQLNLFQVKLRNNTENNQGQQISGAIFAQGIAQNGGMLCLMWCQSTADFS